MKRSAVILNHFNKHSSMQQDESPVRGKLRKALFKKLVGKGVLDPTVHAAIRSEVCPYFQAFVCIFLQLFRTILHSLGLSPVERPILLALTSSFPTEYLLLPSKTQYPPCHQSSTLILRETVTKNCRCNDYCPCHVSRSRTWPLPKSASRSPKHRPTKKTFSCIHT